MGFRSLQKLGEKRLHHVQWAVEVHIHHMRGVLEAQFIDLDERLNDSRVIYYSVNRSQFFDYGCRQLGYLGPSP